ncbi:MAG: c-type cytochrome [Comamonadaceae bacterium]|nr:MAG: c-type cytochrome [Comamonadaceae bacterium]
MRQVASQAGWQAPAAPAIDGDDIANGRGFAYAHVPSGEGLPEPGWSAWVVDVQVDARTGAVDVTRVVLGHEADDGSTDAAGRARLQAQAEALARQLTSAPRVDSWPAASSALAPVPVNDSGALAPLPPASSLQPLLQAPGGAMLPAAAAVANAIFDATGVRLREPPFAGERLRGELRARGLAGDSQGSRKSVWVAGAALLAGAAALLPWSSATRPIAPAAPLAPNLYSEATIERGRLVAAAGDCVACHTAPGGVANAGGLGLPTPFGTIYSTNLTPDAETGIGAWSYTAFERAMRHGISRDGHHLYPAFPYTAFARMTDDDLQSLYAYLMVQPAVRNQPPATQLPFPFGVRPLLAGWNLAFHDATPFQADPTQSLEWNRGAYLVNGIGHCGACHTPRNALGAERTGKSFLAGGEAEGWQAPALGAASRAPVPWTEEELFRYLRFGSSPQHGPAAGPMTQVVHGLAEVAEGDVRAIAHYLANLPGGAPSPSAAEADAAAARLQQRSDALALRLTGPGSRLYEGACATCHEPGPGGLMASAKLPLAVNTNLHDARPDNLVQVLLHGMEPAQPTLGGNMPAFADTFDDAQVAELAHYLRARFAPDRPAWRGVEVTAARLRAQGAAPHLR